MFARVTHYRMKPESVEAAMAMLDTMKPQIMALPGMHQFINTMNDTGEGCVISLVESREISDANAGAVQALWSQFQEHLAAPPSAEGFDVIADWR
ncbi:hypothetical protein [uncultured Roseobacter sp.]|uniref:hypothetical protein n=1 Tax=uncultured Roseobacter sp. TaxID=114847 RepID=UPI00263A1B8F|nr:hypothetical protein [uncultured Roseobacter sp.]